MGATDNYDEVRASGPKSTVDRVVSPGERQMLEDFAVWLGRRRADRAGKTPQEIVDEYLKGNVA